MKDLLPKIDSPDGEFHNGDPASGTQGTRVTAEWLNGVQGHLRDYGQELKYLLSQARLSPIPSRTTQVYEAIVAVINANRRNGSTTAKGEIQLTDSINMASSVFGASALAVKTAYDKANTAHTAANNAQSTANSAQSKANSAYTLAQSKQSPATTLAGYGIADFKVQANLGTQDLNQLTTVGIYGQASDGLATSARHYPEARAGALTVKPSAYGVMQEYVTQDKQIYYARNQRSGGGWSEWVRVGGDSLPVGAVLAFPRAITNPQGFLLADGSTFGSSTYPDLYRALGNSNRLPDLRRSDVGMTAYFATDQIPDGWIAFDSIRSQVTQQRYPELYRYLVAKYGSIAAVPLAEDRFIRNIGSKLTVGQHQKATAGAVDTFGGTTLAGLFVAEDSNPDGRHIAKTRETIGGDDFITDDYTLYKRAAHEGLYAVWSSPSGEVINPDGTSDGASKDIVLYGMRPRAIALKLCIKAQNTFDDVQFWIKAFGAVTNAGELDAGRLAQDLQGKADKATTLAGYGITDGLTSLDFLASLNANGYQKLPSGLIIQWGIVDFTSNSSLTCTFPIVFPRNVFSIMTHDEGSIVGTEDNLIRSKTVTGFTLTGPSNRNKLAYLAIGY